MLSKGIITDIDLPEERELFPARKLVNVFGGRGATYTAVLGANRAVLPDEATVRL